jgi:hypothetical protein
VYANYYDPKAGWLGAEPIGQYGNALIGLTDAAMDAAGNAFVVHRRHLDTETDLVANRFEAGNGWTGSQLIENDDSGQPTPHGIGLDAHGDLWVFWRLSGTENSIDQLLLTQYDADVGWQGAVPIASADQIFGFQTVRPDGVNLLTWTTDNGMFGSTYDQMNGLGTVNELSTSATVLDTPELLFDGMGNGLFLLSCKELSLCAARFLPGSGWSELEVVATSTGTARLDSAVMDGEGRATIAWVEHLEGAGTVHSLDFR